jgi:hypothetical protein
VTCRWSRLSGKGAVVRVGPKFSDTFSVGGLRWNDCKAQGFPGKFALLPVGETSGTRQASVFGGFSTGGQVQSAIFGAVLRGCLSLTSF